MTHYLVGVGIVAAYALCTLLILGLCLAASDAHGEPRPDPMAAGEDIATTLRVDRLNLGAEHPWVEAIDINMWDREMETDR